MHAGVRAFKDYFYVFLLKRNEKACDSSDTSTYYPDSGFKITINQRTNLLNGNPKKRCQ